MPRVNMKTRHYLEILKKLIRENPEAILVYAIDEEGNAFHPVGFDPSSGLYSETEHAYVSDKDPYIKEFEGKKAICIN